MSLDWNETQDDNGTLISVAQCAEAADEHVYRALEQAIEKAVGFLTDNVKDESRYFLFEWNSVEPELTVVVADDEKNSHASKVVKISFSGMVKTLETLQDEAVSEWAEAAQTCADNVKYFIRDYLTTSRGFHQYSLIAVFQNTSRDHIELL